MPNFEANKAEDFLVYDQILNGAYFPANIPKSHIKSSLHLVRYANTQTLYTESSKEEAHRIIAKTDFKFFGYSNSSDAEITYVQDATGKLYNVLIKPKRIYGLSEDILLPVPLDEKTKIYTDLLADDFKRMKIRAIKCVSAFKTEQEIILFGKKQLQNLELHFHNGRFFFNALCTHNSKSVSHSDLYIIYVTNLFIIRALVFYSKYLNPFLNNTPKSEIKLREKLNKSIPPILKHPWLYDHRPSLLTVYTDFYGESPTFDSNAEYSFNLPQQNNAAQISSDTEFNQLQQFKHSIKTNCSSKVFVDIFYQLLEEQKIKGEPIIECDSAALSSVLSYFFANKNGEPYNNEYTRALLKPSNFIKRPKLNDKNRIIIQVEDEMEEKDKSMNLEP